MGRPSGRDVTATARITPYPNVAPSVAGVPDPRSASLTSGRPRRAEGGRVPPRVCTSSPRSGSTISSEALGGPRSHLCQQVPGEDLRQGRLHLRMRLTLPVIRINRCCPARRDRLQTGCEVPLASPTGDGGPGAHWPEDHVYS
uniref:Putative ptz00173 60s ribosomal protein l10 n=1 Tax=Ixodes ricinus TaxID=34613 RepID=A0A0K8R5E2_IXORI